MTAGQIKKKEKLHSFDNTWNSQSDDTNPHSNHTLSEWKKIGESLGLEFIESVEWQWGKIDFVPGVAITTLHRFSNDI
ncbi:MAG: hypothetical protein UX08_C0003G0068 [Candidatus Collierbacteria bacterium GW2011_GWB1_45_35]|nr:MAG: hypothetical protein UX08_C0003G0068 [Candidatus Collierbacteria bacterium GW2011_GWB1_45_35]